MKTQWWVAITVVGAIGLPAVGILYPNFAAPITTAVLTATFIAMSWNAIETGKLVDGQERTAEISRHPWLKAADLKPEPISPTAQAAFGGPTGRAAFGGWHIWLPITNVGHTPAVDLEIEPTTTISDPGFNRPRALRATDAKRVGQTLVPQDALHLEIARAFLDSPHSTIEVKVRIAYRTIDGGRGQLDVGFQHTAEKGWRNLPTRYETWLGDGTHFR